MSETLIGLLHPGEMGAAVAACLTGRGYQVLWVPAGRGPATQARAAAAGLTAAAGPDAAGQAADLARRADIILSVCPPHAALEVARAVAAAGFTGVYVDANAISPGTAHEVGRSSRRPGPVTWTAGSSAPAAPGPGRGQPGRHPPVPGGGPVGRDGDRPRRAGSGPVRGHRADPGNSPQRQPGRGLGPQDGLRRLDQGQRRAAPGRPGAGPGRGRGGQPAGRVVAVPARAGRPVAGRRPGPRRPRAGAGSARWRRSPPA